MSPKVQTPTNPADVPVVILCGGHGSRLREETEYKPKPMVKVGGTPILRHIMVRYAIHGFRRFILCLGYRGEIIREYFLNYRAMESDFTVQLGTGGAIEYETGSDDLDGCRVTLVDTGQDTLTATRIVHAGTHIDAPRFFVAYGDTVTDVDPVAVLQFHQQQQRSATVTVVNPRSRFGLTELSGDEVLSFREKPELEGWVSAGSFVFERSVLSDLEGPDRMMEQEPLHTLAADGQLAAFRHRGFWQPMDTYREYELLNRLWSEGDAPWLRRDGIESRASA